MTRVAGDFGSIGMAIDSVVDDVSGCVRFAVATESVPIQLDGFALTLYIGRTAKGFVIKKGHTFLMTRILLEGGCDIRFEKRDYDFPSCPWLDGFRDQQADIFRVLPSK